MVSEGLKVIIKQNSKYATFLRIHEQPTSNKLVGVYCSNKTDWQIRLEIIQRYWTSLKVNKSQNNSNY